MNEKRENLINCLLVLFALALAAFMVFYEIHSMKAYADSIAESGNKAGFAIALIVIIPMYIALAVMVITFALFLLALSVKLGKTPIHKKKRTLIALIVFKFILAVCFLFTTVISFGMDHATLFSKIAYLTATAVYLVFAVVSICARKNIINQVINETETFSQGE